MTNKVVIISGFDRSGKSSAAEIFSTYGFSIFECGAVVRNSIRSSNKIDISNQYEMDMMNFNSIICSEVLIRSSGFDQMCIVGVRSIELFRLLTLIFPGLKLIFIEAEKLIRYQRHVSSGGESSISLFQNVDEIQVGWGLNDIREHADFIIKNNSTSNSFNDQVTEVLKQI